MSKPPKENAQGLAAESRLDGWVPPLFCAASGGPCASVFPRIAVQRTIRIDNALFGQICPLMSEADGAYRLFMTSAKSQSEHDAILKVLQSYIDGCKQGNSELMRCAFHPQASFFGYAGDQLAIGLGFLFDWIERNGPAPDIDSRVLSVDIAESRTWVTNLDSLPQDGMSGFQACGLFA